MQSRVGSKWHLKNIYSGAASEFAMTKNYFANLHSRASDKTSFRTTVRPLENYRLYCANTVTRNRNRLPTGKRILHQLLASVLSQTVPHEQYDGATFRPKRLRRLVPAFAPCKPGFATRRMSKTTLNYPQRGQRMIVQMTVNYQQKMQLRFCPKVEQFTCYTRQHECLEQRKTTNTSVRAHRSEMTINYHVRNVHNDCKQLFVACQ